MAYFEIRGGLKKLEFERLPGSSDEATRAVVEFVYPLPLAAGQCARIMLGLHNGVERELIGVPEFLGVCGPQGREARVALSALWRHNCVTGDLPFPG